MKYLLVSSKSPSFSKHTKKERAILFLDGGNQEMNLVWINEIISCTLHSSTCFKEFLGIIRHDAREFSYQLISITSVQYIDS